MKRMQQATEVLRAGLTAGIQAWWQLARIAFPMTLFLLLFQEMGWLAYMTRWLEPLTGPLHLPGEAALPLLIGVLVNKFAAISGLLLLPLTPGQYLVAAVFLALAHNVMVELLIVWRSRLPAWQLALLRTGVAYLTAWLVALVANPGGAAEPALLVEQAGAVSLSASMLLAITTRSLLAVLKMAYFVLPLLVLMEALRQMRLQERLERAAAPLARWLRLSPGLGAALLAGLLLGVATGAAVIDRSLEQAGQVDRRELWRLNTFLLLFHSVVEDTLMFALFPVPVAAVAAIRLAAAYTASRLLP